MSPSHIPTYAKFFGRFFVMKGKEILKIDGDKNLLEMLKPWLLEHGAKYKTGFGWYFDECAEVPILPIGITSTVTTFHQNNVVTGNFLGEINAKLSVLATYVGAYKIPSRPNKMLYSFLDEEGNSLTWTTSPKAIEVDKKYLLTGIVRSHNIYKNKRQTALSHCRLVEGVYNGKSADETTRS